MPHVTETMALKDPFLDRRRKLLPCQREMVVYWYKVQGAGIRAIARMFKVDRRLIQFILFPERHKRNLSLRQDRGGSKIYYDRVEHNEAAKVHRQHKYKALKDTQRPRPIMEKPVQVHFECVCGRNVVDTEMYPIMYKDFRKAGIVRRKDKSTGKLFLTMHIKSEHCNCYDD